MLGEDVRLWTFAGFPDPTCGFEVSSYLEPNEDWALLKLRAERRRSADARLRLRKELGWWSKGSGATQFTIEKGPRDLTSEVGGERATTSNVE